MMKGKDITSPPLRGAPMEYDQVALLAKKK